MTRAKAQSGQSPDRVASPREDSSNHPRKLNELCQGKAISKKFDNIRFYSYIKPQGSEYLNEVMHDA